MTREIARTQVHNALGELLRRGPETFDERDRLFDDLAVDSTTIIELLLSLEDRTGIEIDPDELDQGVFDSVGTLINYVETKMPGAS